MFACFASFVTETEAALLSSDIIFCPLFVRSFLQTMALTISIAAFPFRVRIIMEYGAINVADRSRTVEDESDEWMIDADEGPKVNDVLFLFSLA